MFLPLFCSSFFFHPFHPLFCRFLLSPNSAMILPSVDHNSAADPPFCRVSTACLPPFCCQSTPYDVITLSSAVILP